MSLPDEPVAPTGSAVHVGEPGPTTDSTPQMPLDPMAMTGGRRWVLPAIMLTILVALFFMFAWWLQDVAAPFINEGEAEMGQIVTFEAAGGTYRVVTSGPSRPEAERMECAVMRADGSTETVHAGDGSITPHDRFGVSRVLEFDVPAGETSVTCTDEFSPRSSGGRFQIVESGGIKQIGLIAGGLVGALAVISLITSVIARLHRWRQRRVAT